MACCDKNVIRNVVYATNTLFALFGIILLAIGIVGMTQYSYLAEMVNRDAFKFIVSAGVFVIITCMVGNIATWMVMAEADASNNVACRKKTGRLLLFVYFFVMLLFVACQLVGAGLWLGYAYEFEHESTGNDILDESASTFQDFVDRRVNCSFNYCCQRYTNPDDAVTVLRSSYIYESIEKSGGLYTSALDKAHEYYKGHNFVPLAVETEWKAEMGLDSEQRYNRTAWSRQFYDGFATVAATVNADTIAPKLNQEWNATAMIAQLESCDPTTAARGSLCWLRWKATCPEPVELEKAAWDDICSFVHTRETWVYTDTDARPNKDDSTEPLLTQSMCDMRYGDGVTDKDYGYKTALISKLKNSIPLAIALLIFALIQIVMLIMVLVVVFHFCCEPRTKPDVTVDLHEDNDL